MPRCMLGLLLLALAAPAAAQAPGRMEPAGTETADQAVPAKAAEEPIAEHLNPGEPVRVAAGRQFAIRIASNPTTGYGWQLARPPDPAVAVLVTNTYAQAAPDTPRVGVGGHEVWTFKAVGAGQTAIALEYIRPWEKDKPPARTNVFTVIVK